MIEFLIMIGHCAWARVFAMPYGGEYLLPYSWVQRFKESI